MLFHTCSVAQSTPQTLHWMQQTVCGFPSSAPGAWNERLYGALQVRISPRSAEEYGRREVHDLASFLRRSAAPAGRQRPLLQANDPATRMLRTLPRTECLKDVLGRMLPLESDIKPDLAAGKTVLVAHTVTPCVRWLHLEGISDEDIAVLTSPPVFRCATSWMRTSSPSRLAST